MNFLVLTSTLNKYYGLLGLLASFIANAQITGPEQDCINAIPLNAHVYNQPNSYAGLGNVNDLNGESVCLVNDENNSVWFTFQVNSGGTVEFDLVPFNSGVNGDDYDFTIFDLTGYSCPDIPAGLAPEVRCNYAFTTGATGLRNGFAETVAGPGDSAFLAPLVVNSGDIYALLVDNFSNTSGGFQLDFSASTVALDPPLPCKVQHIEILPGWNLISSYIIPDSVDVLDVIKDISQDVILIKNGAGQAAIPSLGINSIGDWNVLEGYKVKSSGTGTLSIGCTQANPDSSSIPLSTGWTLISYLRDMPMDIGVATNNISPEVLLIKDGVGNSYIPSFGINTIGSMVPGKGYSIKMANPATLIYPSN